MKSLFKICFLIYSVIFLVSCEREDQFLHGDPVNLKSWLEYEDTEYCKGTFQFNNNVSSVLVRSNFEVLSDTQWSFLIKLPKDIPGNLKGINYLGFKFLNTEIGKILKDESYTSKIVQTINFQFNSQQTKIVSNNFIVKHSGDDFFELNGHIKVFTESIDSPLDSFEFDFNQILVEKSYVRIWVNGSSVSPFTWDIDLKAGNEYAPEPTITIMPEFGKLVQIGIALIDGKNNYLINTSEKEFTNFKNSGISWKASSGYFLFDKFYYKDIIKAKSVINYKSPDNLSNYSIDSVKINYCRIPF